MKVPGKSSVFGVAQVQVFRKLETSALQRRKRRFHPMMINFSPAAMERIELADEIIDGRVIRRSVSTVKIRIESLCISPRCTAEWDLEVEQVRFHGQ
jgi:hypothetical protein